MNALLDLENHRGFQAHMRDNFVYDNATHTYRAIGQSHYSVHPIIQPQAGHYQLQAVVQQEVARVRQDFRHIETFDRLLMPMTELANSMHKVEA